MEEDYEQPDDVTIVDFDVNEDDELPDPLDYADEDESEQAEDKDDTP